MSPNVGGPQEGTHRGFVLNILIKSHNTNTMEFLVVVKAVKYSNALILERYMYAWRGKDQRHSDRTSFHMETM